MREDPLERRKPGISTRAIHGASRRGADRAGTPVSLPLVQSSTFSYDAPEEMIDVFEGRREGYVYSRYDNPTVRHVEEKIASMEGGDFALLFSSGLAAIHCALWGMLKPGERILAARDLYGGTADLMLRILPRLGVEIDRADFTDSRSFEEGLSRRPALVYFETPTNPLLRLIDGGGTVSAAHGCGARAVVDNTFATPVLQNPFEWGTDLVVHSATKYLGGHSDIVLGVVVGKRDDLGWAETCRRTFGAAPDPFAAWLLNRGLATLAVRVRAQCASARELARRLTGRAGIRKVNYPGLQQPDANDPAPRQMRDFGGMLSIELDGGREGALTVMRRVRLFRLATSLGGVESLISHPATSSHRMLPHEERERLGITEGLVRISVGLEDVEDLAEDLEQALDIDMERHDRS